MMTPSRKSVPTDPVPPLMTTEPTETSDVLIFVDDTAIHEASIRHAQKVASAFGGQVVLVQVLCSAGSGAAPVDPVEWDIKKQQTLKRLDALTRESSEADQPCTVELLEGQCISQIKALMELRQGDIAASPRFGSDMSWHLSDTAWGVLVSRSAAVLMIPDDAGIAPKESYRRILVPLDGSSRAETALPKALMLARAEASELVLCYVVPEPGLTEFGEADQETARLHSLVRKRNEQAGKSYLERVRKRLARDGQKISVSLYHDGDVRRALIHAMAEEQADFVVMATHGQSGHRDVPTGDVARFILDKANVPVLLVRNRNGRDKHHTFGKVSPSGVRQPTGTN